MGGVVQFHRALGRPPLPKWQRFQGAGGARQGLTRKRLQDANFHIPWEVVLVCIAGDADLEALQTTVDTHGCLDRIDLAEIRDSWTHAARLNATEG